MRGNKLRAAQYLCLTTVLASCGGEADRTANALQRSIGFRPASLDVFWSEEYGWAEEGGEVTAAKLLKSDCVQIASKLSREPFFMPGDLEKDAFAAAGLRPNEILRRHVLEQNGDTVEVMLEPKSCTLVVRAHYE